MIESNQKENEILGTTELTLKIRDLNSIDKVASHILETKGLAEKIRTIDIETKDEEDEDETPAESQSNKIPKSTMANPSSTQPDKDPKPRNKIPDPTPTTEERLAARKAKETEGALLATRLCAPLSQTLAAILSHGGRLQHFSWRAFYFSGTSFTRPHTFWAALFAHALTLETLRLDYFEHEVDQLPPSPSPFPVLKKLALDTASAHGDNGTSIDTLLKSCPNLSTLDFAWPRCDLLTCQIQNMSWAYTFPSLHRLDLGGYDFDPAARTAFLSRHPKVEILLDAIDAETGTVPDLDSTALPNLKALYQTSGPLEGVARYFDVEASRPICHFATKARQWNERTLSELATLPSVREKLKILELYGDVPEWRAEVEDSSDEEEEGEELSPRMPEVLRACLGEFGGLRELGISLESDGILYTRPDGVFGTPDVATCEDVKLILAHLPPQTQIRALRLWDSVAEPLPQAFLEDFPAVPNSLEYFAWREGRGACTSWRKRMGKSGPCGVER